MALSALQDHLQRIYGDRHLIERAECAEVGLDSKSVRPC